MVVTGAVATVSLMSADQKLAWNRANVKAGIHAEDGLTGMSARQGVIKQALETMQ